MRFAVALLLVAAVSACAAKEEATPDSAAAAVAAAPSVSDFAGTWSIASVLEGSPDTVKSSITFAADGTCSLTLEGQPPIACTTSISADSIVAQTGEYASVRRPGTMVSMRSAAVLSSGMLAGNLVATYKMPTGDEPVNGKFTGTKAP